MSLRSSMLLVSPEACSGDMYEGVPTSEPAWVSNATAGPASEPCTTSTAPRLFAMPQSITSTSPKGPSMMFCGFRSRWMTPCACEYWIA